jgi:hypothetical protein
MQTFLLLATLGCQPQFESPETGPAGTDSAIPPAPPSLGVEIWGAPVIDPWRSAPSSIGLEIGGEGMERALTAVEVRNAQGEVVRILADGATAEPIVRWDGRDELDEPVPLGTYTIHGDLLLHDEIIASGEDELAIVQVGLSAGHFTGEDRLPIMWHRDGGIGQHTAPSLDDPFFALPAIVDAKGEAVDVPNGWRDLLHAPSPEDNAPVAYVHDAIPTLELTVGGDLSPASELALTVRLDGWTLAEGSPGEGRLIFTRDAGDGGAGSVGIGVLEETAKLYWEAEGASFANQEIPLRIYGLLGPHIFADEGTPYLPWVAVIDPALRAIAGTAPTPEAVASALVAHIFHDLGLRYDTTYGASAYNSYGGWNYEEPQIDLTAFIARANGNTVNCSDCAAILTAYADMLGVDLYHSIIHPSFNLNYIEAIGVGAFTNCPFGSGGCGFSYHAVAADSQDSTAIWDATLALDGDGDPSNPPHTQLLVQELGGDEYLDRLVMAGNPTYKKESKQEIR